MESTTTTLMSTTTTLIEKAVDQGPSMMDQIMEQLFQFAMDMSAKYPMLGMVLAGLGSLMCLMSAVVILFPGSAYAKYMGGLRSKPWVGKLWEFMERFSLFVPKDQKKK